MRLGRGTPRCIAELIEYTVTDTSGSRSARTPTLREPLEPHEWPARILSAEVCVHRLFPGQVWTPRWRSIPP
jgi:hypothetical protein